jgi:hypothetical protein
LYERGWRGPRAGISPQACHEPVVICHTIRATIRLDAIYEG